MLVDPLPKINHADDPDETAGRALYRGRADELATAQVTIASRKVKLSRKPRAGRLALREREAPNA